MALRIDPRSRGGSWAMDLGALVLRVVVWGLARSCRFEVVAGQQHLEQVRRLSGPLILSFWHNRSFLAVHWLLEELHRRGIEITVLASQSRDGELVTRLARRWRLRTVRGSATRGGTEALRRLHRAIVRHGSSPVMIPDGPHGPLYGFKVGVAVLAQTSEAPILPLGFAVAKSWRIRSWDRLFLPRPFSRIAVAVGEPQRLERDLAREPLEAERSRLEALLNATTLRAEEAVGAGDFLERSPAVGRDR